MMMMTFDLNFGLRSRYIQELEVAFALALVCYYWVFISLCLYLYSNNSYIFGGIILHWHTVLVKPWQFFSTHLDPALSLTLNHSMYRDITQTKDIIKS